MYTEVKKATIQALRDFFGKNVEFKITSKISDEIIEMFNEQIATHDRDELLVIKDEIERLLKHAASEYKKAKKLFKRGEITIDELIENEDNLTKLKNELEEINFKLRK
jgi:hypothetical protein